jgi:hypothetical protein
MRFLFLMIAAGYQDGDDADTLRGDPMFKITLDLSPSDRELCFHGASRARGVSGGSLGHDASRVAIASFAAVSRLLSAATSSLVGWIACRTRSLGKLITPGANPPQLCITSDAWASVGFEHDDTQRDQPTPVPCRRISATRTFSTPRHMPSL